MAIPTADSVADLILTRLGALDNGQAVDKHAAMTAIVDEILKAVKQGTVSVPGTGLTATDPVSGPLPLVGTATGTIT